MSSCQKYEVVTATMDVTQSELPSAVQHFLALGYVVQSVEWRSANSSRIRALKESTTEVELR